jgi:pimeloyl-ACP methyl ester carboxylesterase
MICETNFYTVPTSQGNISIWDSKNSGHPVFFLHGNSACKESFAKQFNSEVAKKYRFIAMDLPGHGNSDKAKDPENTYSISGYTDVALEVIKQLGLVKPVVVGWSLGGHIGLNMIQKSHELAGLLITGTPPINISNEGFQEGFRPLPLFQTLFTKDEFTREEAIEFMTTGGIDGKENPFITHAARITDGIARMNLVQSMTKGIGGDQKAIVETDDTPLCVIQGANDEGINNDYICQVNYKNLFSNKVHLVENSGHAAFWQKPDEFNQILSLFLDHVT